MIAVEAAIRVVWTDSSFVTLLGLAYLRLIKIRSWGPDRSIRKIVILACYSFKCDYG